MYVRMCIQWSRNELIHVSVMFLLSREREREVLCVHMHVYVYV